MSSEIENDLHVELARANLHRIRGEYKEAEQLALSILRKDPENLMGHTLMGEICAEKGELEQAAEWYELALDLDPDSAGDKGKLEQVKQRIRERDAAATAEQLGLSQGNHHLRTAAVAFFVLVLVVAGIAYALGQQSEGRKREAIVRKTVDAPFESPTPSEPVTPAKGDPIATPVTIDYAIPGPDRLWMESLSKGDEGTRVLSAVEDPRTKSVVITFSLASGDNARAIAAEIGRTALRFNPEALVSVRGVEGTRLTFVATVDRTKFAETETPGWADAGANFADHVLTDEWPKPTTEPVNTNSEGP